MVEIKVRPMRADDWTSVAEIYRLGIASGNATFETEIPSWEKWDAAHLATCRLIACADTGPVGWAALSRVSARKVYEGVAEVSVYVSPESQGRGVGKKLLAALIEESERNGIWTLQAGIFPENVASLRLHRRCGFREVGVRERVGRYRDIWRDVVMLERRSSAVGI